VSSILGGAGPKLTRSALRVDHDLERAQAYRQHCQVLVYRELLRRYIFCPMADALQENFLSPSFLVSLFFMSDDLGRANTRRHSSHTWRKSTVSSTSSSRTSGRIGFVRRRRSSVSSGRELTDTGSCRKANIPVTRFSSWMCSSRWTSTRSSLSMPTRSSGRI
jgi:hypothetical protein